MHRIDQPGNVSNLFVSGNPQTGQRPTRVGPKWLNAVQEEIANAIEQSGIDLDEPDNFQLYQAIVAIATGAAGAGGGSVPTSRQVLTSGLATGGGNLTADRTIDVPKASAAEVLAAAIDTKAITPLAMATAFGRSLTGNGYAVIPFAGGLMLNWLSASIGANATTIFNWHTSFPNACFGAWVNGGRLDTGAQDNNAFASGFGVSNVSVLNGADVSTGINILGLGY